MVTTGSIGPAGVSALNSPRSSGRWRNALLAAIALWTSAALVVLYFDPGSEVFWRIASHPPFTCGRLVSHGAACDRAIEALNDTWHWVHVYPLLAFIVLGYVAIEVIAIRGRRGVG